MYTPLVSALAAVVLMTGTSDPAGSLKKRQDEFKSVRSVAVMIPYPELEMFDRGEVSRRKNRELTDSCTALLRRHVCEALEKKGVKAVVAAFDGQSEELSNLSFIVQRNLGIHTVDGPESDFFPERIKDFSYSVGSLKAITERYHVDAVLFLHGYGEMNTVSKAADGKPCSYETVYGLIADQSGAVLWANDLWFTNRWEGMSFETNDGMLRALQRLFRSDMWGEEWKTSEK